jgi:hypothetical protein
MAVFCSSLTLWFPGMLLTYFLNDFEVVPVAPIITGIAFVFTLLLLLLLLFYWLVVSASEVHAQANIYKKLKMLLHIVQKRKFYGIPFTLIRRGQNSNLK